ncbi:winged helix domain-containing protein [Erythrobacter alti]|uniref:winged helix domain-containing protein n=1 Tax=Erythrobacter alti TaxID=1896145 RepID=UPI0030F43E0F
MENALPRLGKGAAIVESDSAPNATGNRRAKARLTCHPVDAAPFTVSGKTARALRLLATNSDGITPLDCIPTIMRLGSIIWQLRHRYGLAISTEMEPHEDGRHARYRLVSRFRLESG